MVKIGNSHGIDAWLTWMRTTFPEVCQRSGNYDPENTATWPWPERFWRTQRIEAAEHDGLTISDPRPPNLPGQPIEAGHPVWSKDGWMAVEFNALPTPAELVAYGITWVAAPLNHGVNPDGSHANDTTDNANQAWLGAGKAKPYRDAGIKVGGWQWNQGYSPSNEAWIAATHCKSYSLDLFIANGEEVWKGNSKPSVWCSNMATELRTRGFPTDFPVAWSVLGAASGTNVFPFDYNAFVSRGWHILPQAYPQDAPEYWLLPFGGNQGVIEHMVRANVPLKFVHPTIANHGPRPDIEGTWKPTIDQWIDGLRRSKNLGVVGSSLWAHAWNPNELHALATV